MKKAGLKATSQRPQVTGNIAGEDNTSVAIAKQVVSRLVDENNKTMYTIAVILVLAAFEGPYPARLSQLTGFECGLVDDVATRMRRSTIWTDSGVDYQDWFDDRLGDINFFMDLGVAEGWLLRTNEKKNGKRVYKSLLYAGGEVG